MLRLTTTAIHARNVNKNYGHGSECSDLAVAGSGDFTAKITEFCLQSHSGECQFDREEKVFERLL